MGIIPFLSSHKKRTMSVVTLWDNIVSDLIQKNESRRGIVRNAPYYMDLKGFYSGSDNVTYAFTIDGYPKELEIAFRRTLRRECKAGVRMSFISMYHRHRIQWNSPQMKSKLRTWKTLDNDMDGVDEYNLYSNLSTLDSQEWRKSSLTYLSSAELRRKRKTFKVYSMVLISGKRGENFDETIKEVVTLCKTLGIKLTRVMLNIQDYLSVFSPFSCELDDKVLKQVGSNVVTDELMARFSTYSQGTVGIKGMYWGTDIYSGFPALKQLKITDETAENWLITAETGGGKSYFVKALLLQLLSYSYCNGTIMDIEGFEYSPLAYFLANTEEVVILNMAEGTGSYFDPVEIIMTGDPKLDEDMYSLSQSFSISLYKIIVGETSQNNEWVDVVINDAVTLTYAERGILADDPHTWELSKGLTLFSIFDKLVYLEENPRNTSKGYLEGVQFAVAKARRYFGEGESRSHVFKARVPVSQIATAKLLVCSFGMAGKTEKSVDPVQMALMQLCAANMSHLRSIFSKNAGKFNFKLWEEFQRWGNFPDSDKTIGTALTGGRKLGDINIVVTNKVSDMLDTDRFGIFQNITSLAIGCIPDSKVRRDLCERLTIPEMLPELDTLAKENTDLSAYTEGNSTSFNPYSKAFLVGLDRAVYTITKMVMPKGLQDSAIFRTGVDNVER